MRLHSSAGTAAITACAPTPDAVGAVVGRALVGAAPLVAPVVPPVVDGATADDGADGEAMLGTGVVAEVDDVGGAGDAHPASTAAAATTSAARRPRRAAGDDASRSRTGASR